MLGRLFSSSGGAEAVRTGSTRGGSPLPRAAAKEMGFFLAAPATPVVVVLFPSAGVAAVIFCAPSFAVEVEGVFLVGLEDVLLPVVAAAAFFWIPLLLTVGGFDHAFIFIISL